MAAAPVHKPLELESSLPVVTTLSAAEAFGEDIADDAYSVSELSHYNEKEERKTKKGSTKGTGKRGAKNDKMNPVLFSGRTKLALSKQDSVQPDIFDPQDGEGETSTESKSRRKGSSGSGGDKSDEASSPTSGESDESDITITTFSSFAQMRFQMKIPHTYSCSALSQPLLPKPDKADFMASLSSWVTILRIMGDLPDVDVGDNLLLAGNSIPITSRVRSGFTMKYTKKDVDDYLKKYSDLFKDPSGTDTKSMPFLVQASDTMLEKIQMICALGIYKPSLRDELYCQLCKQLSGNPSRNSTARGWVLMSLMVSSFSPSERFISSLISFLREGPIEFADKIDLRLRRTCSMGTRGYPPSWIEFQAAKNGKPLLIPINFMNGHRMLMELDGASSVGEVTHAICQRLGIKESTGLSIYITLQSKISCLGNSDHRVLDAVSECEQHSKLMGFKEANSMWRIFLRHEFFCPWLKNDNDPVLSDLVYQQIVKGITVGEYQFEKEERLMKMASMIYMVEFPDDVNYERVTPFLAELIPENIYERRPENYFSENLKTIVENNRESSMGKHGVTSVKSKIVSAAKDEFHMNFCRFYDATQVMGQGFQMTDTVIGVNHKGIFVLDSKDKMRLGLEFCEIVEVSVSKNHAIMTVVGQGEIIFTMVHSNDFYELLKYFLQELRLASTFALARKDITQLDGTSDSNIAKGDLLELSRPLSKDLIGKSIRVECKRTGQQADIPTELLYILTTIMEPKKEVMTRLVTQMRKDISSMLPASRSSDTSKSLQQYAKSKFRPERQNSVTKFFRKASLKKDKPRQDSLWLYSKDELKKPLLRKTCKRDDVRKLACHTFTSIQTYMANLVINDEVAHYNLCLQWILDPARRNKYIRDEVYCQLIKQLTNNPDRANEDRGWILLSLLTSLTLPTPLLSDHVMSFISSSPHPMAIRCMANIKMQERQGACRLYSSHFLEHAMVSKHDHSISIPVYFPNQSSQVVDVTSQTRIFEIKYEIAHKLQLKSHAEYSLFLTSNEKVHCLLDRSFFFDCLFHSESYWFRGPKRQSAKVATTPMLVMLKKIWVNVNPGDDLAADNVFHFPQEIPNYLGGYHCISDTKMATRMAGLMYRALYGDDTQRFANFGEISKQLFPQKFLEDEKIEEIEKMVKTSYKENQGISQMDAKVKFLQELTTLPTYGSVFFEVKQRHSQSLPRHCLIGLNFKGLFLINKESKTVLKNYEFSHIPNWAHDSVSFTFIFTEGNSSSKLLVETKVGHNIDDLLMSYVAWIMNFNMRKKFGYVGTYVGESIC